MFKKLIAGAVSVALMFGVAGALPEEFANKIGIEIEASASSYVSGSCGDALDYYLDTDTGTLTITGIGDMDDYYTGHLAPWYGYTLNKVILSEGITSIGNNAFYSQDGLTSISIPASVKRIGRYAFYFTGLKKIDFNEGLESIEENAFMKCFLQGEIRIPSTVKTICNGAFALPYDSSTRPPYTNKVIFVFFGNVETIENGAFKGERRAVPKTSYPYSADYYTEYYEIFYCDENSNAYNYAIDHQSEYIRYHVIDRNIRNYTTTIDDIIYTGTAVYPNITIKDNDTGWKLIENVDYTVEYSNNTNIGTGFASITGIGMFSGVAMRPFKINPIPIDDFNVSVDPENVIYNGKEHNPQIIVKDATDKDLIENVDYTVTIDSNINKGEAAITITGTGNYIGSIIRKFTIKEKEFSNDTVTVTLSERSFEYDETEKVQSDICVVDTELESELIEGEDYTVSYFNNVEVGTASIIITGIGNYSGVITKEFTIYKTYDLSSCTATLSYTAITYSPDGINADKYLTVKDGSKTLVQGVDYETSYENNKAVGYQTCTLTIAGKGDYSGTIYKKLTIKPPKLAAPTLTTKNSAIVVNWKKTTTYALGYQVIYDKVADFDTSAAGHTDDYHTTTITDLDTLSKTLSAYTKPGETWYVKVRAFITNDGTTGGTRYGTFSAAKKIVVKGNVSTASIPYASYTYSGSAIKPAVTVKDSKGNKLTTSDYTVAYSNNTKVGTATITITGKGSYQGTITKTFVIKPKAGTLTLTAGTAAFKASWTKNTTATGYRITYSKDKSFASGVYNYTVSKNTTTSANFSSKPKSGETWYVKYRPYITVNGTKYYGSYSAVKTVKTK